MQKSAKSTYVVADASKLKHPAPFAYADWRDIAGVISAGEDFSALEKALQGKTLLHNAME